MIIIIIIAIMKAQKVCNIVAINATKKLVFFQFQKKAPNIATQATPPETNKSNFVILPP
jgi:hypothetical protein